MLKSSQIVQLNPLHHLLPHHRSLSKPKLRLIPILLPDSRASGMMPAFFPALVIFGLISQGSASPIAIGHPSAPHHLPIERRALQRSDPALHVGWINAKYEQLHANFELNAGQPVTGVPSTSERLAKRDGQKFGSSVPFLSSDPIPTFYYSVIQVGSPPVQIHTDLDTGSYDFWVTTKDCQGCSPQPNDRYDASSSHTSHATGVTDWSIGYGDGSKASGSLYQDTVSLAGRQVNNQYIATASSVSGMHTTSLLGMSLSGLGSEAWKGVQAKSVFDNLWDQSGKDSLPAQWFSMKISATDGELAVGGVNTSKYQGDITWIDVDVDSQGSRDKAGFWLGPVDSFVSTKSSDDLFGQYLSSYSGPKSKSVVFDSGTTGIIVDPDTATRFYSNPAAVNLNDGMWAIPCDGSYGGTFTLGGKAFPIRGDALVGERVDSVTQQKGGTPYCRSFLYAIAQDAHHDTFGHWILGDSFLEGVYTVFDVASPRLGFATLK